VRASKARRLLGQDLVEDLVVVSTAWSTRCIQSLQLHLVVWVHFEAAEVSFKKPGSVFEQR
jgi:hypothetical protein